MLHQSDPDYSIARASSVGTRSGHPQRAGRADQVAWIVRQLLQHATAADLVGPLRRSLTSARRVAVSVVSQLLIFFAIATIVPLLAIVVQTQADAGVAEQHAFEQERQAAAIAADDVWGVIDDARYTAQALARLPGFVDGTDADRDQTLAAFAAASPSMFGMVYFTQDLVEHGASIPLPDGTRRDMSIRPYAREAVASGRLAVTDRSVSGLAGGTSIVALAVPLQSAPSNTGSFLAASVALDRLPTLWADVPLATGGAVMLVDTREGCVLAGTTGMPQGINDELSANDLAQIRDEQRTYRASYPNGVDVLRAWAPVEGTPWVVLVDTPTDVVVGPIQRAALQRALLDGLLAATVFVLLLLGWRRLSIRLGALRAAIMYWEHADWKHRAGVQGDDELGQLGLAFDQMAARLEETTLERQAVSRALAEASAREATAKLRDQFLAAVSHDLKNPLTSIKVLAQIHGRAAARNHVVNAEVLADDLARIDTTATRMARMIDELLTATRDESAEPEASQATTNLVAVARQAVEDHQHATERHQLSFDASQPQIVVAWDAGRLTRVLDNLLGNSIKYSPAGGDIAVRVTQEDRGGADWAVLRVCDEGVGIPSADLPRIFEPYVRAGNVVGSFDGSGIGLAGVRRLVELHGGSVAVTSREGAGSTFTLSLPAVTQRQYARQSA